MMENTNELVHRGTVNMPEKEIIKKYKILVIDDEVGITGIIEEILHSPVTQVLVANDTREGIRLAMIEKPSVILLDIAMPEFDGLKALQQLKHMRGTDRIPIVMMTGNQSPETVSQALELGACDYVVKPFEPSFLIQRVSKWLGIDWDNPFNLPPKDTISVAQNKNSSHL